MAMGATSIGFVVFLVVGLLVKDGAALRLEGTVNMEQDSEMAYLGRFMFQPGYAGRLDYEIEVPVDQEGSNLVLLEAEPQPGLNAGKGNGKLVCDGSMIVGMQISLNSGNPHCVSRLHYGGEFLFCRGTHNFPHSQEILYNLALANCDGEQDSRLDASYKIHLTNGLDLFIAEYSADENSNLHMTATGSVLLTLILCAALANAVKLSQRRLLYVTYKIWVLALVVQLVGMITITSAWVLFATDGYKRSMTELTGHVAINAGTVLFVTMVTLLSGGYTIISCSGRIIQFGVCVCVAEAYPDLIGGQVIRKLQVGKRGKLMMASFGLAFAMAYICLHTMQRLTDPWLTQTIYDTPCTLALAGLQVLATLCCLKSMHTTVRRDSSKRAFYLLFGLFTVVWFLTLPAIILLADFVLPDYYRSKYIYGTEIAVVVFGHAVLLALSRMNTTSRWFPYHHEANKVDFDLLWDMDPQKEPAHGTFDLFLAKQKEECLKEARERLALKEGGDGPNNVMIAGTQNAAYNERLVAVPSICASVPHRDLNCYKECQNDTQAQYPRNNNVIGGAVDDLEVIDLGKMDEKSATVPERNLDCYKKRQLYLPAQNPRNKDTIVDDDLEVIDLGKMEEKTAVTTSCKEMENAVGDTLVTMMAKERPRTPKVVTLSGKASSKERVIHVEPVGAPFVKPKTLIKNWTERMDAKKIKSAAAKKSKHVIHTPVVEIMLETPSPRVKEFIYPNIAGILPITRLNKAMPGVSGEKFFQSQKTMAMPAVQCDEAILPGAVSMDDVKFGLPVEPRLERFDDLAKVSIDNEVDGCSQTYKVSKPKTDSCLGGAPARSIKYVCQEMNRQMLSRPMIQHTPDPKDRLPRELPLTGVQRRVRNNSMTKAQRLAKIGRMNYYMSKYEGADNVLDMTDCEGNLQQEESITDQNILPNVVKESSVVIVDEVDQTPKRKRRNPVHKARKMLGLKKKSNDK